MRRFGAEYLRKTRRGMWDDSRVALADLELETRERVLDVGCGAGALTRVLEEECPGEVVGCDADAALLDRLDAPAVRGDALRLPFDTDAVELVVCQALLINLPNPVDAVREFARVASDAVACVEPDNAGVSVNSTVETEAALATRARERYLRGVETDVALGRNVAGILRTAGLEPVTTARYEQVRLVEPPYRDADVREIGRRASGAGLRDRRGTMAGSPEELDGLRGEWRAMGREAVRQVRNREYRRRETVPFYVGVGTV